jgi:hypothetical protein
MLAFILAVLAILVASLIIGAVKWLAVDDNRERLRQRVCRHDWIEADNTPTRSDLIFVHSYAAICSKCGLPR